MSTNDPYRPGSLRAAARTDESRRAIRRLSRNGNSTTISVPPEFLHAMNLLPGARVELVFDREWEGFFVRAWSEPPIAPTPASRPGEGPHVS